MQYKVVQGDIFYDAYSLDKFIKENSAGGWKYHSKETFTKVEKGCVSFIPPTTIISTVFIFYKEDENNITNNQKIEQYSVNRIDNKSIKVEEKTASNDDFKLNENEKNNEKTSISLNKYENSKRICQLKSFDEKSYTITLNNDSTIVLSKVDNFLRTSNRISFNLYMTSYEVQCANDDEAILIENIKRKAPIKFWSD